MPVPKQLQIRDKEVDYEDEYILDFWRTSKPIIGSNTISVIPGAEFDQRGKCYWLGYSNLVEHFFSFISLNCGIPYL